MSKLGQQLRDDRTREQVSLMRHVNVTERYEPRTAYNHSIATIYDVGARFTARVVSTDEDVANGGHAHRVQMAKRQILHEVFGEFIAPLHEAEFALHNYDHETAGRLVKAVLRAMESDTPLTVEAARSA